MHNGGPCREVGVTTTKRVVEDVSIQADYFKSLEPK